MRRRISAIFFLTLLALLLSDGQILAGNHKTEELNRKISEISLLRNEISQKISQARDMRNQLQEQLEDLILEIKKEKNHYRLESFQAAVQNLRIDYDLKLVQQLRGYIANLNQRITYFKIADETLDYYFKQIQDDMHIIRTLNDFQVDNLISQINAALDEYVPETKKHMINVQVVQWIDSEKLWHEIKEERR